MSIAGATARLQVFILAKNEALNIGRTLETLARAPWPVTVLDSGSTDGTPDIVGGFAHARAEAFSYTTHLAAYNEITSERTTTAFVMILDADTMVSNTLIAEVEAALAEPGWDALDAPVVMCVEGHPLAHGSLYPPKPFVFRTGASWFTGLGHAETLRPGTVCRRLAASLRHDDRKPYGGFLASQHRYAQNLIARLPGGNISWRDRLRASTPVTLFAAPLLSLIGRLGILDGRAGIVYALDRLIAEAITLRTIQAERLRRSRDG